MGEPNGALGGSLLGRTTTDAADIAQARRNLARATGNYVAAMALSMDTVKALRTAGRKVTEWTEERDRLVKQAVAEGGSLREVGEAAGISHTAVKFIAHGRPPKP